jgi:hypothetical protein
MQFNSDFDFHLDSLQRDAKNVFDNSMYDTILEASKRLFGAKNVWNNERSIFIQDKINLELCLSYNEPKVYIHTYLDAKGKENLGDEIRYKLMKINTSFRLFGLQSVIEYLQLKQIENKFISNNEG